MTERKDGGPAFPVQVHPSQDEAGEMSGMTLRDWFAGQALAGLMANPFDDNETCEEWSARAYRYADAMLAAREVPE